MRRGAISRCRRRSPESSLAGKADPVGLCGLMLENSLQRGSWSGRREPERSGQWSVSTGSAGDRFRCPPEQNSRRSRCQSACKPGSGWPEDRSSDVTAIPLGRALLRASSNQPGRRGSETSPSPLAREASSLFGFAPGGACHAVPVAGSAVRSYRTFSPLPCRKSRSSPAQGGSISVALSLGSPPPDVIRHRVSVEPGLSSLASESGRPADWRGGDARWRGRRQARAAPKPQLRAEMVRTLAQ